MKKNLCIVLLMILASGVLGCGGLVSGVNIEIFKEGEYEYVYFGMYPQTVVTDSNIISDLNNITNTNSSGYIEYNGEEYKKVTASTYRSYSYEFINGDKLTNGSIYYFKVEPIKWRVLINNDGTYKLLSEYILDNMYYYEDTNDRTKNDNNYMYSSVRAWLNGLDGSSYNVTNYIGKGFLDIAFTEEEKAFINTTQVDNTTTAPLDKYSKNIYVCADTNDKVYLLSYKDMLNPNYGFRPNGYADDIARIAIVSDYARSKGCSIENDGKGLWWLRSPIDYTSTSASYVSSHGIVDGSSSDVDNSNLGVRPALEITI